MPGGHGDGGVALGRPVRDRPQVGEHLAAEPVGQLQVDGHLERAAPAGEVLVELAGDVVEAGRAAQDPRADRRRRGRRARRRGPRARTPPAPARPAWPRAAAGRAGCRRCGRRRRAGPSRSARSTSVGVEPVERRRVGRRRTPASSSARPVVGDQSPLASAAPAQVGDAVGRAAAGRRLAAVEHRRHLGVGQVGEVVVDHGLALLRRQRVQRGAQRSGVGRRGSGSVVGTSGRSPAGGARRAADRSWSIALRWAIVTSQPRTLLSGRSRGYACSADRNVSDQASSASAGREQRPAHPHHDRPVLLDDLLERAHDPMMATHARGVRSLTTAPSRGR